MERFPRQYSWLSELLLQALHQEIGHDALADKLDKMGHQIGQTMKAQLPAEPGSEPQLTAIAKTMTGIGYEATARTEEGETFIEAHNCVFHRLAAKHPEVCKFDVSLLSASSSCKVEHRTCMMRGSDACRFHFSPIVPNKDEH
jgi:predicted ArsR family transcriptional regulator